MSIAVFLAGFAFIEYGGPTIGAMGGTTYVAPSLSSNTNSGAPIALADNDWQKVLTGADPAAVQGKSLAHGASPAKAAAPLTETEKLGEYLVSGYLQLQQSGQDISTDTVDSLVASALDNPSIAPTAKVYAFSDIKIGKNDSVSAAISYGQTVAALFNKNNSVGNEATLARDAEEQNNPTIAAKIDPIIATYQIILTGLLDITVPPSLAKIHLDIVNAMSERLMVAKLLRSVNSDPAAGLEGAGRYLNGLQDLSSAMGALKQYFDNLKVSVKTMSPSELMGSNQ